MIRARAIKPFTREIKDATKPEWDSLREHFRRSGSVSFPTGKGPRLNIYSRDKQALALLQNRYGGKLKVHRITEHGTVHYELTFCKERDLYFICGGLLRNVPEAKEQRVRKARRVLREREIQRVHLRP